MQSVGIEAMNAFAGSAYLDVEELAAYRKLDSQRFSNLLMKEKAVALPYEDPVTFGVNAAKLIIDRLSQPEKDRIELLIACTESAFDFGKSMSSYFHKYLGLSKNCRMFELKSACYSGIAGLQMGINFVLSQTSPDAKALIIASDISRFMIEDDSKSISAESAFAEPSSGAGAVAMLIGTNPKIFQMDIGANGYYGYEVMDTCRPIPDSEAGDVDLSLLSYLDCCEKAYLEYQKKVEGVNYKETFQYLVFHTPFGGMIKGAHRNMMRKMAQTANATEIEADFHERVMPGLTYCQRVGNIMGATAALSLFSTIANGKYETVKRLGCFSYGSGCCSEFFSGLANAESRRCVREMNFEDHLKQRYRLNMDEYQQLLLGSNVVKFGTKNAKPDWDFIGQARKNKIGPKQLYLKEIKNFYREYEWA